MPQKLGSIHKPHESLSANSLTEHYASPTSFYDALREQDVSSVRTLLVPSDQLIQKFWLPLDQIKKMPGGSAGSVPVGFPRFHCAFRNAESGRKPHLREV